jgi:hypothetical protein
VLVGGGLLKLPGAPPLVEAALEKVPDAVPVPLRAEPVFGAVLLAFDAAGVGIDEQALLEQHPAALRS